MYKMTTVVPTSLLATLILVGACFAAPASAAEPPSPIAEYLESNENVIVVDGAVLSAPTAIVVNGDSVVAVVSDDAVAPGAEDSQLAGCDYRNAIFTSLTAWQDSSDGCGISGFDWTARYQYSWSQDTFGWNSGPSCVQGRGYSTSRTVSTPVWFNAGCGGKGSVAAFIGNRATVAKVRGHVNAAAKIGYVRWK